LDCTGVIRELSNYIDGELDPLIKHELERHLQKCGDCTIILDQTKTSIEILCNSQPLPLPAKLRLRLRAACAMKAKQGRVETGESVRRKARN
jgi:predicted anti-sigma-YlaC factor YlaD